jgi:Zn-dependent peptidase ImmA (M78 family)/predicted secreted protein
VSPKFENHSYNARNDGSLSAIRTHLKIGTDMKRRVDIFKIIEDSGVWLMFHPLDNLYGVYVRDGGVGIMINSKHPPTLQRFTAAHEFGHHIMNHSSSLDDEYIINDGRAVSYEEVAAQSFAANFMMPLELVNTLLKEMGVAREPGILSPTQVYNLSVEMGVSYLATINHLASLKKISWDQAGKLRKESPISIRTAINSGVRPENTRTDFWVLSASDRNKTIFPRVMDEIHILLPETPSSGYLWNLDNGADHSDRVAPGLELIANRLESPERLMMTPTYGDLSLRHFIFRVSNDGISTLRLIKARPWLQSKVVDEFLTFLDIVPNPTGKEEKGLFEPQRLLVA